MDSRFGLQTREDGLLVRVSLGHAGRRVLCAIAAVGTIALIGCSGKTNQRSTPPAGNKITIFLTAELKGSIEPCGCTSDPLGDLARTARLVNDARAGGENVLFIDGGSTLYTNAQLSEALVPQETLKGALLRKELETTLRADASGLGPHDLALGKDVGPRHAVNLEPGSGIELAPPRIFTTGGVKVGIFGVVAPSALASLGVKATDPTAAAKKAVATLRADGAQVVVAILHMVRGEAIRLSSDVPGIDFGLVGRNAPEPDRVSDEPIAAGSSWLVEPANRGQIVSRLDITVRNSGPGFADALGKARADRELEEFPAEEKRMSEVIAKWKADPSADPKFIQTKEAELAALRARAAKLRKSPTEVPAKGSYFVFEQVRINKGLACDPKVVTAKRAYDKAAGSANVFAMAGVKPAEPAVGAAGYVGIEECAMCHGKAVEQWKTTKHAGAWETLEVVDKQFNFDCINCHVTGFDKPGGSNLGFNEPLRDVQCEVCHGPGSKHVEADGKGFIELTPQATVCQACHNEEHSDTFDFEPYLRDVTGPGHGEEFRNKLGIGATGLELRSAALKKAGGLIGEGCPK